MRHFSFLRTSFNVPTHAPAPPSPHKPRATSRPTHTADSPHVPRLSRPPTVPGINEDEEEKSDHEVHSSPSRRKTKTKAKPRLSASRLPLPSRVSSPDPIPLANNVPLEVSLGESSVKKKPIRRQSGIIDIHGTTAGQTLAVPRAPSPAFGSPIRPLMNLEEDDSPLQDDDEILVPRETIPTPVFEKKDKNKPKAKGVAQEEGATLPTSREKERKRPKDVALASQVDDSKARLMDVTNSLHKAGGPPLLDTTTGKVVSSFSLFY